MTQEQFSELLHGYLAQRLSEEQLDTFLRAVHDPEFQQPLAVALDKHLRQATEHGLVDREREEKVWASLLRETGLKQRDAKVHKVSYLWWRKWVAAASVIILISLGSYFIFRSGPPHEIAKAVPSDIPAPKTSRAVITLANGQQVFLDSTANGPLATQGKVSIIKKEDGQIAYEGSSNEGAPAEISYNTITNPRGSRMINMTLSDGSKVWLNAESSLRYPVAFTGEERRVQVTGEAYFEVSHNASMPFVVQKNDISVQVLGTHFNVNAYDDEATIKVTLLEGSVKVKKGNSEGLLKPGQQAQLKGDEIKILSANVDEVVAWKNGLFSFEKADIKTIMKEVSRWYGVDVVYANDVNELFRLKTSRNISISNVIKILENTGVVHLEVEGKKIMVRSK